jgi:hypothetical protein
MQLQKKRAIQHKAQSTEDKREKIYALSLAKEGYSMKLDLLTNATVVDDAIRFVSGKSKEKSLANSNEGDKEESNERDYNEDEEQEEETPEEITETTNQIF